MTHIALPVLYKEELAMTMVKPEVSDEVLALIVAKNSGDRAYMKGDPKSYGAIRFGRGVNLLECTNNQGLIDTKNMTEEDPVSPHEGAVEIRFLYIEQTKQTPEGIVQEFAVLELLKPMVFKYLPTKREWTLNHEYEHMLVVPPIPDVADSKEVQVKQVIYFTGHVTGGKIMVTFDKKPYGINPIGFFAKVHRTVK